MSTSVAERTEKKAINNIQLISQYFYKRRITNGILKMDFNLNLDPRLYTKVIYSGGAPM